MSNDQRKKATKIGDLPPSVIQAFGKPKKKKPSLGVARSQTIKVIEFALENGFVITPAGSKHYIESFNMFNCCPCDPARKTCPCPEAVDEIKMEGKCLCHLFWRDYTVYLDQKLRANEEK